MSLLRRTAPFFAAALALIITVQVTDLVRCADEVRGTVLSHVDGSGDEDAHAVPHGHHGPSDDGHDGEHLPDCLCHVIFVPTASLVEVGSPLEVAFHYPAHVGEPAEGEVPPPGHVPIG